MWEKSLIYFNYFIIIFFLTKDISVNNNKNTIIKCGLLVDHKKKIPQKTNEHKREQLRKLRWQEFKNRTTVKINARTVRRLRETTTAAGADEFRENSLISLTLHCYILYLSMHLRHCTRRAAAAGLAQSWRNIQVLIRTRAHRSPWFPGLTSCYPTFIFYPILYTRVMMLHTKEFAALYWIPRGICKEFFFLPFARIRQDMCFQSHIWMLKD